MVRIRKTRAKTNNTNNNNRFAKTVGSKAEVWHGTAAHTSGGLQKKHLMKKGERIISILQHEHGLRMYKNPKVRRAMENGRAPPFA